MIAIPFVLFFVVPNFLPQLGLTFAFSLACWRLASIRAKAVQTRRVGETEGLLP